MTDIMTCFVVLEVMHKMSWRRFWNGTNFSMIFLQDVAAKIMAICQNGPRAVCVLSANGVISMVTLRQQATSGGTATYEVLIFFSFFFFLFHILWICIPYYFWFRNISTSFWRLLQSCDMNNLNFLTWICLLIYSLASIIGSWMSTISELVWCVIQLCTWTLRYHYIFNFYSIFIELASIFLVIIYFLHF